MCRSCSSKARRSAWSATASTTRRRWRRPTSASRSAPAPTSPSRRRDITLISGSLRGVVTAIAISRATMRNVYQNLFGASSTTCSGIPIALGVLYPFFGHPALAAAGGAGDVLQLGDRDHQRQPAQALEPGGARHDAADRDLVIVVGLAADRRSSSGSSGGRAQGVPRRDVTGGYQEPMVLVKGGYTPDVIVVQARQAGAPQLPSRGDRRLLGDGPLRRLREVRRLPKARPCRSSSCPRSAGEYEFACQMGMLRGQLIVE